MLTFFVWILLFIVCWPIALVALLLYPLVWILSLPFRLIGITVEGLLGLLRAMFWFPIRFLRLDSARR